MYYQIYCQDYKVCEYVVYVECSRDAVGNLECLAHEWQREGEAEGGFLCGCVAGYCGGRQYQSCVPCRVGEMVCDPCGWLSGEPWQPIAQRGEEYRVVAPKHIGHDTRDETQR